MNLPTHPRRVLLVAAAALALGGPACNKPEKETPGPGKVGDKESPRRGTPDKGPKGKDKGAPDSSGKVTPEELTRAFRTDPKAAEKKYGGRVIEVEGEVLSSDMPELSANWVLKLPGAQVPGDERPGKLVDCNFEPGSRSFERARKVKAGQKVTVRGKVDGALAYGVRLVECELVEVR
jgi:hypothetical protein